MKNLKAFTFIIIYTICYHNLPIRAQDNPISNYLPPSPNAANLGAYGKVPVNNFMGTSSVEIPIYTITCKS